jgi:hypothetical protein
MTCPAHTDAQHRFHAKCACGQSGTVHITFVADDEHIALVGPDDVTVTETDERPVTKAGKALVTDMGFTGKRRQRLQRYVRDIERETALSADKEGRT